MANGKGILDNAFGKLAKDLIGKLGGSAFINITTDSATDPETDEPTTPVTVRVPASGNIPCIPPFPYTQNTVDGTLILTGDLKSGVSSYDLGDTIVKPMSSTMTITTTDFFTKSTSTITYTIIDVMPVYSGNSQAMVEFQLRGLV